MLLYMLIRANILPTWPFSSNSTVVVHKKILTFKDKNRKKTMQTWWWYNNLSYQYLIFDTKDITKIQLKSNQEFKAIAYMFAAVLDAVVWNVRYICVCVCVGKGNDSCNLSWFLVNLMYPVPFGLNDVKSSDYLRLSSCFPLNWFKISKTKQKSTTNIQNIHYHKIHREKKLRREKTLASTNDNDLF